MKCGGTITRREFTLSMVKYNKLIIKIKPVFNTQMQILTDKNRILIKQRKKYYVRTMYTSSLFAWDDFYQSLYSVKNNFSYKFGFVFQICIILHLNSTNKCKFSRTGTGFLTIQILLFVTLSGNNRKDKINCLVFFAYYSYVINTATL